MGQNNTQPNHFREFPIFWPLSQVLWSARITLESAPASGDRTRSVTVIHSGISKSASVAVKFHGWGAWGGGSAPKGEPWPQNTVHPHRPSAQIFQKTPMSRKIAQTWLTKENVVSSIFLDLPRSSLDLEIRTMGIEVGDRCVRHTAKIGIGNNFRIRHRTGTPGFLPVTREVGLGKSIPKRRSAIVL